MIIQGAGTSLTAAASTIAVTLGANVRAGAVVVVLVQYSTATSPALNSVQDQFGNSYTKVTGSDNTDATSNEQGSIWWFRYAAVPGSAPTITASFSANANDGLLLAVEDAYTVATGTPYNDVAVSVQAAPGTGADGVTLNATPATDNQVCLLWTVDVGALVASPAYVEGTNMARVAVVGGLTSRGGAVHCFAKATAGTKALTATASNNDRTMTYAVTLRQAGDTQVSDDFVGSNANPLPAPWASFGTLGNLQRVSNQAGGVSAGTENAMRRTDGTWTSDGHQWCEIRIASAATNDIGALVRCSASGGNAYGYDPNGAGPIFRFTASAFNTISFPGTGAFTTGDYIRVIARGASPTTIEVFRNGFLFGSDSSDSTGPQSGGTPGIFCFDTTNKTSWFAAGNLVSVASALAPNLEPLTDGYDIRLLPPPLGPRRT
jgi:hypothetical protein